MNMDQMKRTWAERQGRILSWQEKLFNGAYKLRDEVTSQLKPNPTQYVDAQGMAYNVVEVYETQAKRVLMRGAPSALGYLINDELRCSIGITFEKEPGSPRGTTLALVPIGVRANEQRIEWCMWDSGLEQAGRPQAWAPNTPTVATWIIQRFDMMLNWDPMHGPEFKPGMGFL